jgi:hypothetical protein
MNHTLRRFLVLTATAALVLGTAHGQAAKVAAGKPEFDDILSPQFSGGKQESFKPKQWLRVEAKLNLALAPAPKSQTADRIMVKWFVAIKNPDKSGEYLLLTREVEHVNVPLGEDVYVSIYLSPASILRITGSNRGAKGAVEFIGYEVHFNGEKIGEETHKGRAGWWNVASPKISRSDTVPLLTKPETPFAAMWWDRYAEVATERR